MSTIDFYFGRFLKVEEASRISGYTRRQIYKFIDSGNLPAIPLSVNIDSRKALRIPETMLHAFMNGNLDHWLVETGACLICKNLINFI